MSIERKYVVAIAALLIYSVSVAGQEPTDSITRSNYSEPFIVPTHFEPGIILLSDTVALRNAIGVYDYLEYSAHSPAKAAIMSAVLPGLGQVYNKKYWKIPVVYAAIGTSTWFFVKLQNDFSRMRRAYIDINDGDPYTNFHLTLGFPSYYGEAQQKQYISSRKERLRTWRDWSIVAVVATYALNIIDANVDAHLMDFSLDDNISLNIHPCFLGNDLKTKKIGLTLQFTF